MKTISIRLVLLMSILVANSGPSAFAADQVVLKSGDILEGTIEKETTGHIDIRLLSGNKRRVQRMTIESVEKGVATPARSTVTSTPNSLPAEAAIDLPSAPWLFTIQALAGIQGSLEGGDVNFNWGFRPGFKVAELGGFSELVLAFSYQQTSNSFGTVTANSRSILFQPIFKDVSGTGFYFAPQVGAYHIDTYASGNETYNKVATAFGGLVGWRFQVSPLFSIGPEIQYVVPTVHEEMVSVYRAVGNFSFYF